MTKNTHSFPLRQRVGSRIWVRTSLLGLAALTTFFFGCSTDVYNGGFGPRSIGRTNANPYANPSAGLADPKKRAAYWQKRGYSFDPHEISAAGMDVYAAHFTPSEWMEVLNRARAEVAQDKAAKRAAKKAQEKLEAANAAAARKAQRENAANDSTRAVQTESPRAIAPKVIPLPPLGKP